MLQRDDSKGRERGRSLKQGDVVAKTKDKKVKKEKSDKKERKAAKPRTAKPGAGLKTLAQNPLLADVVAAALVATASALKDSKRARALAAEAGDELQKLSKAGAERGNAMWEMALEIGRRSLDALAGEKPAKTPKLAVKSSSGKKRAAGSAAS